MQEKNPLDYISIEEDQINVREQIEKYARHWKWFVVGVVLALIGANLYLRTSPNQYAATTTVLVDGENSGGLASEMADFEGLGLLSGNKSKVGNEMGLLKSRSLMERVVKDLGINVTYYIKGQFRDSEVYKQDVPFKVNFFLKDAVFYKRNTSFTIKGVSATKYILTDADGHSTEHVFGENVTTPFGDITITPTVINMVNTDDVVIVRISPLKKVVAGLRAQINIDLLYEKSSWIELALQGPIKLKVQDILNHLVSQYNKDAIEHKNLIGNNTNTFINERLKVIKNDLSNVDKGIEAFKTTNRLTDIPSEAELILQSNTVLETKILELNTQMKLVDYVADYMAHNAEQLIPANLGLTDGAVDANSDRYNELLSERNRILKSTNAKNPVIINLNNQLEQLGQSISQGLINLKSTLSIALTDAKYQETKLRSRISTVPKQEREYRDIQREQQIIESLYLYLLQKREENTIALTVTVPNAKVIDTADGSDMPVGPKRKTVYLTAMMLGLMFPFAVFYILFMLDNKVHSSKDIEAVIKVPFLGDIPKTKADSNIAISATDTGSTAEAFRMLRTNINFMLSASKGASKTIYVTSTIPNEGKTFIAINLAAALALLNKKVLLIGADIRKPKLAEYLNVSESSKGLTHFLMDYDLKVTDVIESIPETNFDMVHSGVVPPNPSELLMNGRFDTLLAFGKEHYDYVIIDTAPVKMVTDTLLLSENADLCLYVIRADFLDKRLLEIPKRLYTEKRLPNMAVVLNDSDIKKGYGYGYGYAENDSSTSFRDKFRKG